MSDKNCRITEELNGATNYLRRMRKVYGGKMAEDCENVMMHLANIDDIIASEQLETKEATLCQDIGRCFLMLKSWFNIADDGNGNVIYLAQCPKCGDTVVYGDGCMKCDANFDFK